MVQTPNGILRGQQAEVSVSMDHIAALVRRREIAKNSGEESTEDEGPVSGEDEPLLQDE
jgi:hypothetical protein